MWRPGVDVVVLDADLAGKPSVAPILATGALAPQAAIVLLTDHTDPDYVRDATEAGARAILVKARLSGQYLLEVAKLVATSAASVIERALLLNLARRPARAELARFNPNVLLTQRETEILRLLADGLSDQEIARVLGVARTTIHSHISSLLRKVPATNRVQLGLFAARAGVLGDRGTTAETTS